MKVPVTLFEPHWHKIRIEYAAWNFVQEILTVCFGIFSNTILFSCFITFAFLSKKLLNCIPPLAENAKTHLNGASVGMYLFSKDEKDQGIFYFHNSGYNFPVVCEHVPFFAGMRAQNRRRIYLCTDLVWNWI
jgi:hypothetical protein